MSNDLMDTDVASADGGVDISLYTANAIDAYHPGSPQLEASASTDALATTTSPAPITSPRAPCPFSKDSSVLADIVLRSSDGVCYYVSRTILTIASPEFRDMLEISRASDCDVLADEGGDKFRAVDVAEDSKTLDTILRFCYPVPHPALDGLRHTLRVLEASRKYEVATAEDACRDFLRDRAPKAPMDTYIIACKFGMEDIAAYSAQETMYLSLEEVLGCKCPETEEVGFAFVQRLCEFRIKCQLELADIMQPLKLKLLRDRLLHPGTPWLYWTHENVSVDEVPQTSKGVCCSYVVFAVDPNWPSMEKEGTSSICARAWWYKYAKGMTARLSKAHIIGRSAKEEQTLLQDAMTGAILCEKCRAWAFKELREYGEDVQIILSNITKKVASKTTFVTRSDSRSLAGSEAK